MNRKLLSLLVLPALWCNYSDAAPYTGTIFRMVCATTSSMCQVAMNGTPSQAACSTSGWHYTFNASTPEGKNLVSILLAAQLSKQTITIAGNGVCTLASASEDLGYAYITTTP